MESAHQERQMISKLPLPMQNLNLCNERWSSACTWQPQHMLHTPCFPQRLCCSRIYLFWGRIALSAEFISSGLYQLDFIDSIMLNGCHCPNPPWRCHVLANFEITSNYVYLKVDNVKKNVRSWGCFNGVLCGFNWG